MPMSRYSLPLPPASDNFYPGSHAQQSLGMSKVPNERYGHVGFPVNTAYPNIPESIYKVPGFISEAHKLMNNGSVASNTTTLPHYVKSIANPYGPNDVNGSLTYRADKIRDLQKEYPEQFREYMHDPNTIAENNRLNAIAFDTDVYREQPEYNDIVDNLPFNSSVPFQVKGHNIRSSYNPKDSLLGSYNTGTKGIYVSQHHAMNDPSKNLANTLVHEGIHKAFAENNLADRFKNRDQPDYDLEHEFMDYSLPTLERGEKPDSPGKYMFDSMPLERFTPFEVINGERDKRYRELLDKYK